MHSSIDTITAYNSPHLHFLDIISRLYILHKNKKKNVLVSFKIPLKMISNRYIWLIDGNLTGITTETE